MKNPSSKYLLSPILAGAAVRVLWNRGQTPNEPQISNVRLPDQVAGRPFTDPIVWAKEGSIVFQSATVCSLPQISPYPLWLTSAYVWVVSDDGSVKKKIKVNLSRIVSDDTTAFDHSNIYDWFSRPARLISETSVRLNVGEKEGEILEFAAKIGNTQFNSDGQRDNDDSLWVAGEDCVASFTQPRWLDGVEGFVWTQAISGRFGTEHLLTSLLIAALGTQDKSTWLQRLDSEGIDQLGRIAASTTPSPYIKTVWIYKPTSINDLSSGWLYRLTKSSAFPDKVFGLVCAYRKASSKAIVNVILADSANPLLGLLSSEISSIQTFRVEGGKIVEEAAPDFDKYEEFPEYLLLAGQDRLLTLVPEAPKRE